MFVNCNNNNFTFHLIFIWSILLFSFYILDDLVLNSKPFKNTFAFEIGNDNSSNSIISRESTWDYVFDPNEYIEEDTIPLQNNNNNNNNSSRSTQLKQSTTTESEIKDNINLNSSNGNIITNEKIDDEFFMQTSNVTTITTDIDTNTNSTFNFVAVGDWDCTGETKDTVDNIIDKDPELVLALGDLSYNGKAKCWLKLIEPFADKTKIVMGNHELDSSKLTKTYMDYFGLEKQYYSFNYQNVHFLALSTEITYEEDSQQYEFAIRDLEQISNDTSIDWIVAYYHRQVYSSGGGPEDEDDFREVYHPLFDKYKVDLALQGHHHVYERTYPVTFNYDNEDEPFIRDLNDNNLYKNPQGTIFITAGTGGAHDMELSKKESYSAMGIDGEFGIVNISVEDNGKALIGSFVKNENEDNFEILDQFTIVKK
jgi:calcineurin-like phosphoesterase family protein